MSYEGERPEEANPPFGEPIFLAEGRAQPAATKAHDVIPGERSHRSFQRTVLRSDRGRFGPAPRHGADAA